MDNDNQTIDVMDWGGDGMSTARAKSPLKTTKRLIQTLGKQKYKLLAAFLFAAGAVSLNLFAPLIVRDSMNVIFDGVILHFTTGAPINIDMTQLLDYTTLLIAIYTAVGILTFFQEFIMASIGQKLTLNLRERVAAKLEKVPLKYYDTHKKGDILSRVTNDIERLNEIIKDAIMRLFTSFLTIIGAFILMFIISPIVGAIALGSIFVGLLIVALVSAKSNKLFTNRQNAVGAFNTCIEEFFSGHVEIKTFTLEDEVKNKTHKTIDQLYVDDKKAQFIMYVIMPVIRLVNQLGYVGIAAVGASQVISGRINIGQIASFFMYVQMAQEPFAEATFILNSLQSAIASSERIFEILDEENEVDAFSDDVTLKLDHKNLKGDIVFENVQFGYSEDALLMNGVNFAVKSGQKIAIVGPTGAGKTTLVNLLMRFYEISGGSIKVDGIDIRELSRKELRSMFGMVLQDSWVFDGTISENISYGLPNAPKSEIVKAAKLAKADYFIRTLPDGYNTQFNDETATLSNGEKQLLCIARCIVANPTFLLLDEATSSVDTRTELHIQKAMNALMKNRTSFIIAHRLSTIKNADLILVMKSGDIVETGTHDELLSKKGMYAEIYNSQFVSG
ncbi:MAG: ABC transporter ATP-binding protein/permease [Oscillospiraceae bacterium]|nr:ABC transporter ATP-binding protein/permease [Oscillospiraceae bacterium]